MVPTSGRAGAPRGGLKQAPNGRARKNEVAYAGTVDQARSANTAVLKREHGLHPQQPYPVSPGLSQNIAGLMLGLQLRPQIPDPIFRIGNRDIVECDDAAFTH